MKAPASYVVLAVLLSACAPPAAPVEAPEPAPGSATSDESGNNNGIPWAPGEGPGEARAVGKQPKSSDEPMSDAELTATHDDGVVQESSPGCTGKAPLPLRAEIQARTGALKDCSQSAPPSFRGQGELRYTVRVEKDGAVSKIYQLSDTLHVPDVTRCVEAKLKEPFTERPAYGCAQFVIPYQLLIEAEPSE